ncbi:MAG: nickel pincer cofactor biosynthesis protein LarC [Candidatus Latescibacterota bacterium]
MKIAYFDCMSGISGDMTLGALVHAGMPLDYLRGELAKLPVQGYELREEKVIRGSITAVHLDVDTGQHHDEDHHHGEHDHGDLHHGRPHDHDEHHEHSHEKHSHKHEHRRHPQEQHEHRRLSRILELIGGSDLSDRIKSRASAIFTRLAEAEARVHGTTPEEVHFHEVGAVDAIVDVVGSCIGLEYFGVDTVVSTPIRLGTGTVKCAHGLMPVPVPAVMELTRGIPTVRTMIQGELTTPTGAAILTTLASSWGRLEEFTVETFGYGAGTKVLPELANVLRISIGRTGCAYEIDHSILLETNIDNMNPEVFGYLSERLFEAEAKDVYMTPIYMKKGRPGTLLSLMTDESRVDAMLDIIFRETTTLGVRISRVSRRKVKRESGLVRTEFGPVQVKVAHVDGYRRFAPEYEDCARIARERKIPILTVYDLVRKGTLE